MFSNVKNTCSHLYINKFGRGVSQVYLASKFCPKNETLWLRPEVPKWWVAEPQFLTLSSMKAPKFRY